MIDTLYVVNAVQDTLKLSLLSSNNSGFMLQFITLLIALAAVVVGPLIGLHIAKKQRKIDEKKIKENREIEEKKIKSELIYKDKQKWIVEFRTVILEFSNYISEHIYNIPINEKEKALFGNEFIMRVDSYRTQIALLSNRKDPQIKIINTNMFEIAINFMRWNTDTIDQARANIEVAAFTKIEETQQNIEA